MLTEISNEIIRFCGEHRISLHRDQPLNKFTTFKTGGNAALFLMPDAVEKSMALQEYLSTLEVDTFVLGGGSNLLISDAGFAGVVIKPDYPENLDFLTGQGNDGDADLVFRAPASARSSFVGKKISSMGFGGLEFLTTIPGTLGGALVQNAGCYGFEIADSVEKIGISDKGSFREIEKADAGFAYRSSVFKQNPGWWVHYATFRVQRSNLAGINDRIARYKEHRRTSQPKNRKNAGSIFKNPPEGKAWKYIQDCGLQGFGIGQAEVSHEHANFIVNTGQACSQDIYKLMMHIRTTVAEKCNIFLEPEIVLLGQF